MIELSLASAQSGGTCCALHDWASIATVAAVPVATIAAIVALVQYIGSARAQARAHMHSVFRDYLALRVNTVGDGGRHLLGYRYYAMEEAYFWLKNEWRWTRIPWLPRTEYDTWLATIRHHIAPDRGGEGEQYFRANTAIYGPEFVVFVLEIFNVAPEIASEQNGASQPVEGGQA